MVLDIFLCELLSDSAAVRFKGKKRKWRSEGSTRLLNMRGIYYYDYSECKC